MRCICCEGDGSAGVTFTQGLYTDNPVSVAICMPCVIRAARYMVTQAREVEDQEDASPLCRCNRAGCNNPEDCVHIVYGNYYCRTCFGEFMQRCGDEIMSRTHWCNSFVEWASRPRELPHMAEIVPAAKFEAFALTARRR